MHNRCINREKWDQVWTGPRQTSNFRFPGEVEKRPDHGLDWSVRTLVCPNVWYQLTYNADLSFDLQCLRLRLRSLFTEHVVQAAFGSGSSDNEPTNESGSSTSTEIEEEDEILWDKQLLLIKYTPECNGKMSKSGAFGLVVEKLSKPGK